MRSLLLPIVLLICIANARGGGFQLSDHSARTMALGGVSVAVPGDATSIFTNPSAISLLRGTHFSVGTTIIIPENRFTLATDPEMRQARSRRFSFLRVSLLRTRLTRDLPWA